MENTPPTRMELLKKKNQIKLAKSGHDLLKKKRDALILEFFKILKKAKNLRKELYEMLEKANESLYFASMFSTFSEIEVLAGLNKADYVLEVEEKNVMGVRVPKIEYKINEEYSYPDFLSSSQLYNLSKQYKEIFRILIEIAQIETSVKRMIKEIEKTKRRVNALEYEIIPKLEESVKNIKQRLEEIERDSFVSLKVIKRRLEKKKEENVE